MEHMGSNAAITDDGESKRQHNNTFVSDDHSAESGGIPGRPESPVGGHPRPRERGRVRFNSTGEVNDEINQRFSFPLQDRTLSSPILQMPMTTVANPAHSSDNSLSTVVRHTADQDDTKRSEEERTKPRNHSPVQKPRHPVLRHNSAPSISPSQDGVYEDAVDDPTGKVFSALAAKKRGERMATLVGSPLTPASRRNSIDSDEVGGGHLSLEHRGANSVRIDDIPLVGMERRIYSGPDSESDDDHQSEKPMKRSKTASSSEAHKLVRAYTRRDLSNSFRVPNSHSSGLVSGQVTPTEEQHAEHYVARPQEYRGGVLSSLLKLYNTPGPNGELRRDSTGDSLASQSPSETPTPRTSGTNTPSQKHQKWYKQNHQHSNNTLAGLVEASAKLGSPAGGRAGAEAQHHSTNVIAAGRRSPGARFMDSAMGKIARPRLEDEIRITVHIAETLSRQKYLIKLCKALMSYGAPTHRLEEYLKMTARVLEIEAQFLYIPGCMLISFDDSSTHTTEVKLVRTAQGVDLGKLKDVHEIYKEVVHDVIGVEEATQRLETIMRQKQKNNRWFLVLIYGLASASVGPFAFEARLIDLPICFLLGCLLGILQLIIAPKSDLYSNVFEISAAVLTSFLARAFGSIPYRGGTLFCFSALAQSAIALILPGYMVLCGSLELQSKSIVAGSVRMVYAIIYSLFLGFGITIGTAIYGLIDQNATSSTTCSAPMNEYYRFFFVPLFTLCLCIINQAKWKQIPVMLAIAFIGYVVNFFSAKKFPSSAQISNTLGALAVGVLGNLYSRMRHGLAAAALLPAIFVQVPSGLAASGSLLAGLSTADQLTNSSTYANGTAKVNGTNSVSLGPTDMNSVVLNVGYSMIQVAIGITVGLFLSALIVYPLGKRRSGLFSF